MDYAGWITTVCNIIEYPVVSASSATPTGTAFDAIIPSAIDYTENRIQRDLDLVSTTATRTGTLTPNQRSQALPVASGGGLAGTFIVASQIRLIIGGVIQAPLEPVSRPFLDFAWPNEQPVPSSSATYLTPLQWAPNDQANVLIGPAPNIAYGFEVVGTQRFSQLSNTNTSNFLTLQLPDLYVAASLVFIFGFQRDFGGQAEDPSTAQSWENQYQTLLKSASVEEARKTYMDMSPSPSKPSGLTSQTGG